ncbi:hypothetical protein B0H16DRAFT_1300546, partial [Mycena metata]
DSATATSYELLRTMDLAMLPVEPGRSTVDDFAVILLRKLGYTPVGRRAIRTRKNIPFLIYGEKRLAKTDVCIIADDGISRVGKNKGKGEEPIPHLVAEAITVFRSNNVAREQTLGLSPIPLKVIPGIPMEGTSPTFFKIPVTQNMMTVVMGGVPCY